jgi:hypothetical protein
MLPKIVAPDSIPVGLDSVSKRGIKSKLAVVSKYQVPTLGYVVILVDCGMVAHEDELV